MSKLEVDTIAPQSGTTVTVGESGDTVTIPTGVTLDASNATTTLPANVVTTDGTQTLTNKSIAATQLTGTITPSDGTVTNAKVNASAAIDYSKLNLTGNIALADLSATGTKDATTFLRGDNTFAEAGGGIENVTSYRLTSAFTAGTSGHISTNLSSTNSVILGTAVSESSGTFSFPQTGIWLIMYCLYVYRDTSETPYIGAQIKGSNNGGASYSELATVYTNIANRSLEHGNAMATAVFDVTNISNDKIQFHYASANGGTTNIVGNANTDTTYFRFIRLGDT